MRNGYAQKVDRNQPEIVAALRKAGAKVKDVHTIKGFCDILAYYDGVCYHIEIKDSEKPASQRRLTEGEIKCKDELESVGVPYYVVNNIEEALHLVIG